jgi:SAM-dependent methyltransferase
MAQITHGIRAILSNATVYSLFRKLIIDDAAYVRRHVPARAGDRVLDIGCGPADVLASLPDGVHYEGFDASPEYIERARRRFGDRGTFHCARVDEASLASPGSYQVVLAYGVLHHLDDPEALALFRLALRALAPGGRLITTDPCYVPGQSPVARYIISKDRGQNVRDRDGYLNLARQVFTIVDAQVRHDILRIPYTHVVLDCHTS